MTPSLVNRLLIVGASARAAAWSARRAGLDVVAADLFADTDLQQLAETIQVAPSEYPQALADLVRQGKANVGADAWMYTGCLENYPLLVHEMSGQLTLLGNNADVIDKARDPLCLARIFATEGISFPRIANIEQITETSSNASCWLLKPFLSGGGHDVRYFEQATWSAPSPTRKLYLQQFIEGQPHSAVFMASHESCDLIGVTRLWCERDLYPNARQNAFRYSGSTGPVLLNQSLTCQWQQIGDAVVRHAGLRGVFGVDAIVAASNVESASNSDSAGGHAPVIWPIEVNPRYTASVEVLERSLNISLLARHVRVWTGQTKTDTFVSDSRSDATWIHGKRILYASRSAIFDRSLYDSLLGWQADEEMRQIADQPRLGTKVGANAPICTLIAGARTAAEVELALGFARWL